MNNFTYNCRDSACNADKRLCEYVIATCSDDVVEKIADFITSILTGEQIIKSQENAVLAGKERLSKIRNEVSDLKKNTIEGRDLMCELSLGIEDLSKRIVNLVNSSKARDVK